MDPQMADKVVDAGDGRIVSFPGSMGDEDIAKALRPAPDYSDNLARSSKPTKFEQENSSVPRNFVRGVGESVHKIGQNLEHMNPIEAGMSMVGGGGMPDIQPPAPGKEFKWSDAKPSIRNVGRSLVDDIAPGKDLSERGANAATLPLTALMAGRDVPIQGQFPHYNPPEQVPFSMSRATARTGFGAAADLLSPHPSTSRAAMTAGVGLASEVLPWAATKAARSQPVVDFLTRKGGPRSTAPAREPLWKQAEKVGKSEYNPQGEPSTAAGPLSRETTPTKPPASKPVGDVHPEVEAAGGDLMKAGEIAYKRVQTEGAARHAAAGDTATRLAGQPKNLATDMTEAESAPAAEAPESVSATDGRPTPPNLPKLKGGNLPIPDVHKDAFQRFVKSKGKEGPLARQTKKPAPEPVKPPSTSRRPDMQDDQAVRQEIEQRTQVRPKEPGRKGKAQLAADMKAGKGPKSLMDELSEGADKKDINDMFGKEVERLHNKDLDDRQALIDEGIIQEGHGVPVASSLYSLLDFIPDASKEAHDILTKYGFEKGGGKGAYYRHDMHVDMSGKKFSLDTPRPWADRTSIHTTINGKYFDTDGERGPDNAPKYMNESELEEYLKGKFGNNPPKHPEWRSKELKSVFKRGKKK